MSFRWLHFRPELTTGLSRFALFGTILFAYLYFFPYVPSLNNPNENTRIYITQSIVENGSITIGRKEMVTPQRARYFDLREHSSPSAFVNDTAIVCEDPEAEGPQCTGPLYAAKAPGNSVLALPAYLVMDALGMSARPLNDPGVIWLLRVWGVVLPSFLFLLGFFFFVRRWRGDELVAQVATLGLALGTMAYPYSIMMASHYLQGASLCGAFMLLFAVRHWGARKGWLALAGFLAGFAVVLDYPAAMAVILMGLWVVLVVRPWLGVLWFVLGGLGPAVFHSWYHLEAFGSPAKTGHLFLETAHNRASQSGGFLGIERPSLANLYGTFVSPDVGLLFLSPWLILGLVGLVFWLREKVERREAILATILVVAYTLFVISLGKWRTMVGWTIGPRYLAPVVPFLALAAVVCLQRMRGWLAGFPFAAAGGLVMLSVGLVTVSTITYPQFNPKFNNPIFESGWALLKQGVVSMSLATLLGAGRRLSLWLFFVPLCAVCAGYLLATCLVPIRRFSWRWGALSVGRLLLAGGLAVALAVGGSSVRHTPPKKATPLLKKVAESVLWYEKSGKLQKPAKPKPKKPGKAKKPAGSKKKGTPKKKK